MSGSPCLNPCCLTSPEWLITDTVACIDSAEFGLRSYWYLILHSFVAGPAALWFGDGRGESACTSGISPRVAADSTA